MKNKKLCFSLGIIIGVILVIVGASVFGLLYLVNKEKDGINSNQFESYLEEKAYVVADVSSQAGENSSIKKIFIATPLDYSYKIEFYELKDEASAMRFYNANRNKFQSLKKDGTLESEKSFANYSKYTLVTDSKYQVVSRIDNTVIYIDTNKEYKETINEILKTINY